ncbi:DUF371 domain-containing protein [Haloferax sp. MBLA0076]|uniref:DUF371 domain-containing protein n=1 Tax=Haloferax litoreum TaxID=2666140 RepID=A0A6A8GBD1_9EURY|nr:MULTISPECIES: DUF371 domain-containing protein [Haloferax]KAB1192068.1 DUF371 domain-containing protein [Haloferax sp. CBA1148]MRX20513.1 DUF371 domain-containing protein [Haloferax litoreum]
MDEVIRAHGHEHVRAEHASTFEVTSDDWLTPAGDCILAIEADRTPADFADEFVDACQSHDATISVTVAVDTGEQTYEQTVRGRGHPDLTFDGDRSIVFRTSDYVDDRTGMVGADHAADGFDDELVAALASGADLTLTIRVE